MILPVMFGNVTLGIATCTKLHVGTKCNFSFNFVTLPKKCIQRSWTVSRDTGYIFRDPGRVFRDLGNVSRDSGNVSRNAPRSPG